MGSQSAAVAKQSSQRTNRSAGGNAPPRAASLQFAEDQDFVSPGSGPLPRSIARIAADAPAEPAPLHVGPLNLPLERKLAIGETHDPLEAEADSMADRVLRMTDPTAPVASSSAPPLLRRKCSCEGSGSQCKECEEADRGKKLHRKDSSTAAAPHEAPPIVHDVLRSPGHPLDAATRAFFEPRFGYDFSSVRVHANTHASESAHSVNALAYTVGHNLVFGSGNYAPYTSRGRFLLAHELSHVVQQGDPSVARREPVLRRAPELSVRDRQLACVVRLGGCASSRDGGIPSTDEIQNYNKQCSVDSHYAGSDIFPTNEECVNPPREPLSTAEKIFLGAFLLAGAAAAIVALVAAGEVVIPIVIASVGDAATAAVVYYLTNAIVVNEIGLFATGLLIACEGNVIGLLRATADDPVQAAQLFAELYILHVNISIANGPPRRASVPVKMLPADEQTDPAHIRFRSAGPPVFEEEGQQGKPVPSQQRQPSPGASKGVLPPAQQANAPRAAAPIDQALADVEQDLNLERAGVAQKKSQATPAQWAASRVGDTKRLYNLLEKRAVLARMKAFPGRIFAEQARIVGVESGGRLRPTKSISRSGKGRIVDILEVDGSKATLDDLKSPSTQLKSVQGGIKSSDIEAQFRTTSEIAEQHAVEQEVIAEARRTGGKIIIEGRHPVSGANLRFSFDPNAISSRVTDYTAFGNN